jgi:tyrosyl-tRNA synthetase
MTLREEIEKRGLVHQTANGDVAHIVGAPRTVYLGIDPTAESLQVGNLVPLMLLKRLAEGGHRVILLIGEGTAQIGDPGGKASERVLLDRGQVYRNRVRQVKQVKTLLRGTPVRVVNNNRWLSKLSLITFLRDIGKYFTVNALVKRDIIRPRLETDDASISVTEFCYSLLQAYDYWYLFKKYGCNLQIGGSDQWANIISGVEYIRKREGKEVYAMTVPILEDNTGRKFGKTEGNAVWLDAHRTKPYDFYQFFFNQSDEMVEKLLYIFASLEFEAIQVLMEEHRKDPQKRYAQKTLAREVTKLVHGTEIASRVELVSTVLFGLKPLNELTGAERNILALDAPTYSTKKGDTVVDMLVGLKLASSKREARDLIMNKGVSVGGVVVTDPEENMREQFVNGLAVLKKGKSSAALIVLN